ncbi:MAG: ABC transporter ATP-binding protein [Erysipelothrix sp.]
MKESLKYFWHYLKEYKLKLTLVIVSVLFSMYFVVRTPEFIGDAINELTKYLAGSQDKSQFFNVVFMMALFAGLSWIFSLVQNVVMTKISGDATDHMRKDLFSKIERLPIRFFDQSSDGEILSRFTSDLDNISNTLNQSIHQIISNVAMLGFTLVLMFMNHVELSFVALSTVPIMLVIATVILKKAQVAMSEQQRRIGEMNGFADERFTGQKLVIANGLQEDSIENFKEYNEKLFQATFKSTLYPNLLFPTLQGLQMVTSGIVIFYGAWMTTSGRLPLEEAAGLLFVYTQYVRMIYQPLSQIASQFTQMQLAFTGAQRIMEIMNEPEEIDNPNSITIDGIQGNVELDNVSFAYDDDNYVLKDINIKVDQGMMVALVGHTGSGKTTIMNLLNRFYDIEKGSIKFDGTDIRTITKSSLRNHVGIVLQDSVVFTGTVHDNIAFGRRDASREEVIAVAKSAHIHDFIMTLEDGYDTTVSESNSAMSVGQKQLLSIARTMLVNPDLLILDEATSNVDTVTEHQIQAAMDEIVKGRTSFVIAHRLKTILEADHIIVLQDGQIIEEGTHQSLLDDQGHYSELYHNQFVFENYQ